MSIDDTTIITPGEGTTGGNLGELTPTQVAWSDNPENISIGEGDKITIIVNYESFNNIIDITTSTNDKIEDVSFTEHESFVIIDGKLLTKYYAKVTVIGAKKGGGTASFTVTTQRTARPTTEEDYSRKTTTVSVEAAIPAKQIKFFDIDKNQLADNKLIAPKYIYAIEQNKTDPAQGTKASNSTKCLKTTNNTEYVKFTYQIESLQSFITVTDYSRVSLSNIFSMRDINMLQTENHICLNGIIDDPSRNITQNMLLRNGDPNIGFTYWCVDNRPASIT